MNYPTCPCLELAWTKVMTGHQRNTVYSLLGKYHVLNSFKWKKIVFDFAEYTTRCPKISVDCPKFCIVLFC